MELIGCNLSISAVRDNPCYEYLEITRRHTPVHSFPGVVGGREGRRRGGRLSHGPGISLQCRL